ncbi:LytTR family transcriptional regulator DNA-binding domain-containing protein [Aquimarina algicola]|uniref:HTH LytTR-type domain-containing protein n=1 Tax=Aquimarina algicola TaxID=2589995 RepID=A0A504JMB4_9FLAO|nr:LytTR family transcriptional regulator DNA-binding domain-containing protein [Aquimarina algicola]TPN88823.1 hypothetical protein FHK87_01005 [Aquimarina algicola]
MKFRKILNHLVFWVLFLLLWSVHDLNYHSSVVENIKNNIFTFIPYALLVYINLYVLVPKFLLKKQIISYILLLVLGIIAITFCCSYYLSYVFTYISLSISTSEFFLSISGKIAIVTEIILALCLSMTLFLIDEWYKKEGSIKEIEQKQIETELNLLTNQVSPEVLYNSLNTIFNALGRNVNNGKKILLQFSEMLSQQLHEEQKETKDHIFIKCDGMIVKIKIDEVLFITTAKDYVQIHTNSDKYLTLVSLKHLEEELPKEKFVRIHRYYLVGLNHVKKIEGNLIYVGDHKIKISRTFRNEVYKSVVGNRLVERM